MSKQQENQNIHKKLKELRRARGLTVNTLAKKMGENSQKVGRIERGDRSLTIGYLAKISKALQTPIESLLEDQSSKLLDSHPEVLNQVLIFVEEYCKHLSSPFTTVQKAQFISKIYEMTLKFPNECRQLFLSSLSCCMISKSV